MDEQELAAYLAEHTLFTSEGGCADLEGCRCHDAVPRLVAEVRRLRAWEAGARRYFTADINDDDTREAAQYAIEALLEVEAPTG